MAAVKYFRIVMGVGSKVSALDAPVFKCDSLAPTAYKLLSRCQDYRTAVEVEVGINDGCYRTKLYQCYGFTAFFPECLRKPPFSQSKIERIEFSRALRCTK